MRRFIIVSHRGSIACRRAGGFSEVELRAFCAEMVVERARRAHREETEPGSSCLWRADRGIIVRVVVEKMVGSDNNHGQARMPKPWAHVHVPTHGSAGAPACSRIPRRG